MYKCNTERCLVNLSNSILQRYGVKPFHKTIPEVDAKLAGSKRTILFLFDGLGTYEIEKHLPADSFLRTHVLTKITSTFPPTTVAATTALLSGKFPNETGWMAWSMHFDDIKRNVNVFTNEDSQTGDEVTPTNHMESLFPYTSIIELINQKAGKEVAHQVMQRPIDHEGPKNLKSLFSMARDSALSGDESFVYAYWTSPDALIHKYGVMHRKVHSFISKIDCMLAKFHKANPDITFLVVADHGLIDVKYLDMNEHPDLVALLKCYTFFEKRSVAINVKGGWKERFGNLFLKYYGEHFDLITKDQIVQNELFGPKPYDQKVRAMLPDYLAVSKDEYALYDYSESHLLKGHHGGPSKEEYEINVAFVEGKK